MVSEFTDDLQARLLDLMPLVIIWVVEFGHVHVAKNAFVAIIPPM